MTGALSHIPAQLRGKIQRVQQIVKRKTGVDTSEEQIHEMHLRCLEPEILAKAICFGITHDPIDGSAPNHDGI